MWQLIYLHVNQDSDCKQLLSNILIWICKLYVLLKSVTNQLQENNFTLMNVKNRNESIYFIQSVHD